MASQRKANNFNENICGTVKYLRTGSLSHLSRISRGMAKLPASSILHILSCGGRGAMCAQRSACGWNFGVMSPMWPFPCFHSSRVWWNSGWCWKRIYCFFNTPWNTYILTTSPPEVCLSPLWRHTGRWLGWSSRWTLPRSIPVAIRSSYPAAPAMMSSFERLSCFNNICYGFVLATLQTPSLFKDTIIHGVVLHQQCLALERADTG